MSSTPISYAHAVGIESTAAAVLFTILYIPLTGYWIWRLVRQFSFGGPIFAIAFFCLVRVVAFLIRSLLASQTSIAGSLNGVLAYSIVFNIGYLGLITSGYTLVLDRQDISGSPAPELPLIHLARNRKLYRTLCVVAVALGIYGFVKLDDTPPDVSTGNTLRRVSTIIFLALTALFFFQTFILYQMEHRSTNKSHTSPLFGARHGVILLSIISFLLLIREIFSVATIGNFNTSEDEKYWYPFVVVTEFLAILVFSTPGLIPPKVDLHAELPTYERRLTESRTKFKPYLTPFQEPYEA